jgi:hypothetical protein
MVGALEGERASGLLHEINTPLASGVEGERYCQFVPGNGSIFAPTARLERRARSRPACARGRPRCPRRARRARRAWRASPTTPAARPGAWICTRWRRRSLGARRAARLGRGALRDEAALEGEGDEGESTAAMIRVRRGVLGVEVRPRASGRDL